MEPNNHNLMGTVTRVRAQGKICNQHDYDSTKQGEATQRSILLQENGIKEQRQGK